MNALNKHVLKLACQVLPILNSLLEADNPVSTVIFDAFEFFQNEELQFLRR